MSLVHTIERMVEYWRPPLAVISRRRSTLHCLKHMTNSSCLWWRSSSDLLLCISRASLCDDAFRCVDVLLPIPPLLAPVAFVESVPSAPLTPSPPIPPLVPFRASSPFPPCCPFSFCPIIPIIPINSSSPPPPTLTMLLCLSTKDDNLDASPPIPQPPTASTHCSGARLAISIFSDHVVASFSVSAHRNHSSVASALPVILIIS